MKNKFKTLKLFSGAAVMATLCFMASGVGATRAPEGNNTHDIAHYKRLFEEAGAARNRMNNAFIAEMNAADRQWKEAFIASIEAEVEDISKRWRKTHNAYMLAAEENWKEVHRDELENIDRQLLKAQGALIATQIIDDLGK